MTVNINKTGKLFALTVILFSGQVFAQQNESLLNFKFNHQSNINNGGAISLMDTDAQAEEQFSLRNAERNADSVKFTQYDATWTYPWESKNINIDVGVTLRHLSGQKISTESLSGTHFNQTLPLLHASALFNFAFKGLSAGIEGSHLDSDKSQIFDYRAKVSYEWRKGFGFQGGWQHQQFTLDKATDNAADYERNGPFIDFYLNF